MEFLFNLIQPLQSWLFEGMVLPALYRLGFMSWADSAYDATGFFVLGIAEVALVYALLRPLEAVIPAERWADRKAVWPDVIYTLLYRTGALPLVFFLMLEPLLNPVEIGLREIGYLPPNLEELVPWLGLYPLAAFFTYALIIDFFEYWRHRMQHRFDWWWALHAVHHSQQRMSLWTDDRNHLLDGLIEALWLALLAWLIGVPGSQFALIIFTMKAIENLSHANVHFGFGALGDRLLVSPHYHRIHHGIGVGHEGPARGCNFATLFPFWDILFRTANFDRAYPATGIRDQLEGVDYGRGFWAQQWLALRRMVGRPPASTG